MIALKKPINYWSLENCKTEALKYDSRKDFHENTQTAYHTARRNGWLDEICSHMKSFIWTKERCQQEALKYKSRSDFQKSTTPYQISFKNGWLNHICSHMVRPITWNKKWTFESTKVEASKYNSRTEFKTKSSGAYDAALKNSWLDIFFPKKQS